MKRGKLFWHLQGRFRQKRFERVTALIRETLTRQDRVSILDAGGRATYWAMLPEDLRPRCDITILNYATELAAYSSAPADLRITEVQGDACHMPQYTDGAFDIVHSNSVIEHVGSYANMRRFAQETQRVGRAYYVQTPNFWFPVDPHYGVPLFHWLPDCVKIALFSRFSIGFAAKASFPRAMEIVDGTKIISSGMMRRLFADGVIHKERLLLLAKSTIAIRRDPAAP